MNTRLPLSLTLVAFLFSLTPALAQEKDPLPPAGSYSIGFDLPEGGGGGFIVRKMVRSGVSAGIHLTGQASWVERTGEASSRNWTVGAYPDLRWYRSPVGRVVPFIVLGLGLEFDSNDAVKTSARTGLGAEWFPVDGVSIVGSTGISVGYSRSEEKHEGETMVHEVSSLNLFRSALSLNFHF